jgi:hypothetical protein
MGKVEAGSWLQQRICVLQQNLELNCIKRFWNYVLRNTTKVECYILLLSLATHVVVSTLRHCVGMQPFKLLLPGQHSFAKEVVSTPLVCDLAVSVKTLNHLTMC